MEVSPLWHRQGNNDSIVLIGQSNLPGLASAKTLTIPAKVRIKSNRHMKETTEGTATIVAERSRKAAA